MFRAFVISSPYRETNRSDLYAHTSAIIDMDIRLFLISRQKFFLSLPKYNDFWVAD
jgi:hypothetical protein